MQVGERVFVLSGKFKDNFAAVDSVHSDGTMVICRGGEWDVVGDTEIIPENIGRKE